MSIRCLLCGWVSAYGVMKCGQQLTVLIALPDLSTTAIVSTSAAIYAAVIDFAIGRLNLLRSISQWNSCYLCGESQSQ